MTYLGLPGRVLNLDITFGFSTFKDALGYSNYEYLRDTWVAEFPHKAVYEFFDSDREFRQALSRNMLLIETDMCRYTALFRPNYTYLGLYHLLKMLADNDQYISQQSIASLMNLDRTSITKAMSRLKKEEPEVWERYQANKSRKVSRPIQP